MDPSLPRPYMMEGANSSWASSSQTVSRVPSNTSEQTLVSSQMNDPYTLATDTSQFSGFGTFPGPDGQKVQLQTDNIMNRRAEVDDGLYQKCLKLRKRLLQVPGFQPYIMEMEQEEQMGSDKTDPVTLMWNLLRQGLPLITVFNALNPEKPLLVNAQMAPEKLGKHATFKFIEGCRAELKIPPEQMFIITDLYGSDTTGFVKVATVVDRVLDILSRRGLLLQSTDTFGANPSEEPLKKTHKQNVIDELVRSERDYVQHLETLQRFKSQVGQTGAIPGDAVHDIFLNLDALLDFQRRFLIRVEQQNSLEENLQDWGKLFVQYQDAFKVYEPFIANQQRCNETVMKDWDKLKAAAISSDVQGIVATESVLLSFLMKPFQRLTKYPLLLDDLRKRGGLDEEKQISLEEGSDAAKSVLIRANEAVDQEARQEAVSDLYNRVEDWKGHNMAHFGELLLYGSHTVLKGEGQKEVEREYKVYLFERILLCCKEINPNKSKNRLGNNKSLVDKRGKLRLQLKGRIFMQNVTDVASFSKQSSYYIQIFWRGDPGVENFVVRFQTEETMNKWRTRVEAQRGALTQRNTQTGTSNRQFLYLQGQEGGPNPYAQEYDGEEDEEQAEYRNEMIAGSNFNNMSRNTSSTSLRSRSTTGGSGPPNAVSGGRVPPPRFPMPDHVHGPNGPPLTVSTNIIATPSPVPEDFGNSYFSPTAESPSSTRSNSTLNGFQFARQNSGWGDSENKHRTAPPIGRAPSRDGFSSRDRAAQRPSLQAVGGTQSSQRLRSVSTPDIHNNPVPNAGLKRQVTSMGITSAPVEDIPVPPIPPHMAAMRVPINRSPSNSPLSTILPVRTTTQSPKLPGHRNPGQKSSFHAHDSGVHMDNRSFQSPPMPSSATLPSIGQRSPSTQYSPMTPFSSGGNAADTGSYYPVSQLKVKIWFEPQPSHVTIVVPIVIKHRSLVDRIDSKMERVSHASIVKGTAKLKYYDADGDSVTLACDEDVQIAIEEWAGKNEEAIALGSIPDFELYWTQQ
ncbi:hypothetical protein MMC25_008140 [Agyrium rufum]|nr:hypothetical protein [Agyrium rufum]